MRAVVALSLFVIVCAAIPGFEFEKAFNETVSKIDMFYCKSAPASIFEMMSVLDPLLSNLWGVAIVGFVLYPIVLYILIKIYPHPNQIDKEKKKE